MGTSKWERLALRKDLNLERGAQQTNIQGDSSKYKEPFLRKEKHKKEVGGVWTVKFN